MDDKDSKVEEKVLADKKAIGFFQRIYISIFKVEKYGEFLEEKPSTAIKYILLLVVLMTAIITFVKAIDLKILTQHANDFIVNEMKDFTFEDGILDFSEIQEKEDQDTGIYFLADTNAISQEKESEYIQKAFNQKYGILLFKEKMVFTIQGVSQEFPYNEYATNFDKVTKADLIEELDNTSMIQLIAVLSVTIYISLYLSIAISLVFNIILMAIFANIIVGFMAIPIKKGSALNISIYSFTLSNICNLIYNMVYNYTGFEIKYFNTMYMVVAYIYMIAALLIIKSDIIKKDIEVSKVVEIDKEKQEEQEYQEENPDEKEKDDNQDKGEGEEPKEKRKRGRPRKIRDPLEDREPDGSEI